MRPNSQIAETIDVSVHNDSTAQPKNDKIPYPLNKESINDSMRSYLNKSYIESCYVSQNIDVSYGDMRKGVGENKIRPSTCKGRHRKNNSCLSSSSKNNWNGSQSMIGHKRSLTVNRRPVSSSFTNIKSWGIQGYKVPHWGLKPRVVYGCKFIASKFDNFITAYTKSRKFMPPPGCYDISQSFLLKKGKWPKGKRVSFIKSKFQILRLHQQNKLCGTQRKIK
jgi:hypothetical protein